MTEPETVPAPVNPNPQRRKWKYLALVFLANIPAIIVFVGGVVSLADLLRPMGEFDPVIFLYWGGAALLILIGFVAFIISFLFVRRLWRLGKKKNLIITICAQYVLTIAIVLPGYIQDRQILRLQNNDSRTAQTATSFEQCKTITTATYLKEDCVERILGATGDIDGCIPILGDRKQCIYRLARATANIEVCKQYQLGPDTECAAYVSGGLEAKHYYSTCFAHNNTKEGLANCFAYPLHSPESERIEQLEELCGLYPELVENRDGKKVCNYCPLLRKKSDRSRCESALIQENLLK